MSNPSKKVEEKINRFDDIFHVYGDDLDEDTDANIDFDQFFTDFQQYDDESEHIQVPPLPPQIDPIQENETSVIDLTTSITTTTNEQQQQHLSQRLSQSLTANELESTILIKEESNNDLPKYLSATNKTFEEIIKPVLEKTANTINIEDLRQIAFFKHKLAWIDLDRALWTIYLQSGTSKLKEDHQQMIIVVSPYLGIWPDEVKTTIIADRTMNPNKKLKPNQIKYDTCLNYANNMLRQLREQYNHYQTQLKEQQQSLTASYTLKIEETIDKFVEQYGIAPQRILIESKIVIVESDYHDKFIEREFYQEQPYQRQIDIFQKLSKDKFDKEVAKMEVAILKQRLVHNQLPSTFDSLQIPTPITLDTIQDENIRQCLTDRYEKIVQQTKSDMIMLHIQAAETKMNEYKMKFDTDMAQMKHDQRMGSADKKLTDTMIYIMERRFKNMNKRLLRLYDLKVRFFAIAPAVVKH